MRVTFDVEDRPKLRVGDDIARGKFPFKLPITAVVKVGEHYEVTVDLGPVEDAS